MTSHYERKVALSALMLVLTGIMVIAPHLSTHSTLVGCAVNLYWLWEV